MLLFSKFIVNKKCIQKQVNKHVVLKSSFKKCTFWLLKNELFEMLFFFYFYTNFQGSHWHLGTLNNVTIKKISMNEWGAEHLHALTFITNGIIMFSNSHQPATNYSMRNTSAIFTNDSYNNPRSHWSSRLIFFFVTLFLPITLLLTYVYMIYRVITTKNCFQNFAIVHYSAQLFKDQDRTPSLICQHKRTQIFAKNDKYNKKIKIKKFSLKKWEKQLTLVTNEKLQTYVHELIRF